MVPSPPWTLNGHVLFPLLRSRQEQTLGSLQPSYAQEMCSPSADSISESLRHPQPGCSMSVVTVPNVTESCLSTAWFHATEKMLGNAKQQSHINKTAGVSMGSSSNDGGDKCLITLFWRLIPEGGWALRLSSSFLTCRGLLAEVTVSSMPLGSVGYGYC